MSDFLEKVPVEGVAAWYRRLGQAYLKGSPELEQALAGVLLLQWLDNRKPEATYSYDAPSHLKTSSVVRTVLSYHRNVFMTYEKGRVGKIEKWVGILPRIQGLTGFSKWDMHKELSLSYESLCDIAPKPWDILRIQHNGSSAERDILGSLRGFQLKSEAVFTGTMQNSKALIKCKRWTASATDCYDWNYDEFLTVPNPDYKSKDEGALAPSEETVLVRHKNAKRLEDAKLACPFDVVIRPWVVSDAKVVGDSSIDTTKKL